MRKPEQRIEIDLKQLVARIVFEHIGERLAGMAGGIKPGAIEHARDLVPQIGHGTGRTGIGGRGEQADDAQLTLKLAVRVENLDADVIEIDAAMDASISRSPWRRKAASAPSERRGSPGSSPPVPCRAGAPSRPGRAGCRALAEGIGIAQHVASSKAIFPHAEKGEIIRQQPIEKLHGLGDLIGRQQRRARAVARRDLGKAGAHRQPVGHCSADIREDRTKAA